MANCLDPVIWHPVPIAPIPMQDALRDAVLARSIKRIPKWKFRITDDIALRVQPRPVMRIRHNLESRPWFDCLAVRHNAADGAMLKDIPIGSTATKFKLSIRSDCGWNVEPTACRRGPLDNGVENIANLLERVFNLLPGAFKPLRIKRMLQLACLCCGKMPSDPISVVRWFWPECAVTLSSLLPLTFKLGIEVPAQL